MKLRAKFEKAGSVAAKAPATPIPGNTASAAARNLAMTYHLEHLIERGVVADFTAAARLLGVSQPRLTHLMSLRLLAPVIQEAILAGTVSPPDKKLRRLARIAEWREQGEAFSQV